MKRHTLSIAGVLGGLALAGGITTTVGAQGQGQNGDETIVVYEKANRGAFKFVDNRPFTKVTRRGPRKLSAGDSLVIRSPLYGDAAGTQTAGRLFARCESMKTVRSFDAATFLCDGIARLGQGDIAFHGVFEPAEETFRFAVTGGTREFEDARGQITLANQPNEDSIDTIHLLAR